MRLQSKNSSILDHLCHSLRGMALVYYPKKTVLSEGASFTKQSLLEMEANASEIIKMKKCKS